MTDDNDSSGLDELFPDDEPDEGAADTTDEPPKNETAEDLGRATLYPLVRLWGFVYWFVMGAVSRLPFRTKVYRAMITKGYENLQDNTSGHFVVNTIYGDGACVPRPATIDSEEQTIETSNEEYWSATSGVETVRIGNAQVATGVADHHELVDPIAARIAEAKDLSPRRKQEVHDDGTGYRPVRYQDPMADQDTVPVTGGPVGGQAPGPAETDGGQNVAQAIDAVLEEILPQMNTFDDVWLDVSNPDETNDGWIVSMEKAYEMHWDQAASEEMQKQEDRGRLAEMDPEGKRRQQIIIALVGLGGVALGLFGPALAQNIAGSASGGSGGGGTAIGLAVEAVAMGVI